MRPAIRIAAAALAAFVVVLIARFPAKWLAGWLAPAVSCPLPQGTVWSGTCSQLAVRGVQVGDLSWTLRPARLLRGKLGVHINLAQPAGWARGELDIGLAGDMSARDLQARFALERAALRELPPGVRGHVQMDLASIRLDGRAAAAIEGEVRVLGLRQRAGMPLGDYRAVFPRRDDEGEPTGRLTDLGNGPVALEGTVRLTREPGYVIEGRIAARRDAPPALARQIEYLGTPDGAGRRPFSIAGAY